MATAQQIGIRKYLTDRGYADEDISWDPKRSQVLLQGKDFISATPAADNYTYGTAADLDAALNRYRGNQQQDQTAQYNQQIQPLLQNYTKLATAEPFQYTPYQPFNYTPETDPAYQAALRTAQSNAASSQNNTLAKLRSLGQGKSSYSETLAQQIGQRELGKVTDQALPQLLAQAYAQYSDAANRDMQAQQLNYNAQQGQLGNLGSLISTLAGLGQRGADNTFRAEQATSDDAYRQRQEQKDADRYKDALAQWYTSTYGKSIDPAQDIYGQVAGLTPYNVQQDALNRKTEEQQNAIANQIARQNAGTQAYNAQTSRMNAETNQVNANNKTDPNALTQEQVTAYNNLLNQYKTGYNDPQAAYEFASSPQGKMNALQYGLSEGLYNQMVNQLKVNIPQESKPDAKVLTDNYNQVKMTIESPGVTQQQALRYLQDSRVRDGLSDADYRKLTEYANDSTNFYGRK